MIVGAAYQDTGLLHTNFLYKLEVLLACADPAGYLGKLVTSFHTFIYRISVFLAVKEEFTRTNHAVWSAQFVQIVIDRNNLLCGIRCTGLLTVTKCSICNPDILWHIVWNDSVIEGNLGYLGIRKHISEYIWLLHIIQDIHMLFDFKQVVFCIH